MKTILTLLTSSVIACSAFGQHYSGYDGNGNYHHGYVDPNTGASSGFDSQGNHHNGFVDPNTGHYSGFDQNGNHYTGQ
jgi:hypothetical protein